MVPILARYLCIFIDNLVDLQAELELHGYSERDDGGDSVDDDTKREAGSLGSRSRFESQANYGAAETPSSLFRGLTHNGGSASIRGQKLQSSRGHDSGLPNIQTRGDPDRAVRRGRAKPRNPRKHRIPQDDFVAPAMSPKRGAVLKLRAVMSEKALTKTHKAVSSPEKQLQRLQRARCASHTASLF
jgi:hypothetical protein